MITQLLIFALAAGSVQSNYWLALGAAHEKQHQYQYAVGWYSMVLQQDPRCAEAYNGMARSYAMLGAGQHVKLVRPPLEDLMVPERVRMARGSPRREWKT